MLAPHTSVLGGMWNWKQRCIEDKSTSIGCSSLHCKNCFACVDEWYAWHMDCCSHAVPFRTSSETTLCPFNNLTHNDTAFSTHVLCRCRGSSESLFSIPLIWRVASQTQRMQSCHGICHVHIELCICSVDPQASRRVKDQNRSEGHGQTAKKHKTVLYFALHQAWHWPPARHLKFTT